ncbi:MAG: TetR/AcrR family transcriptional regulator [Lachnospiraceae bacterium]|nr:TetR/AcrR family transcriptional regulator [Lachnospiraceae bacterium]
MKERTAKAPGKAEANKKMKKDALLKTAFELFTDQGIHDTTISNIAEKAGVAKGTFYLYFKDKYDIRNFLIARKAGEVFARADEELKNTDLTSLEDKIVFLADHIISQFSQDRTILVFISKNLSWGIFKKQLLSPPDEGEMDLPGIIREAFETSHTRYRNPEVMIFMIIELLSGAIYSSILYEDPLPIDELKPYLFASIRSIMRSQEI